VQGSITGADGPCVEGSRPAHLIIVACCSLWCTCAQAEHPAHWMRSQARSWRSSRSRRWCRCACASAQHACVWPVHHVHSPCLAMLCPSSLALVCTGQTQTCAMPMHASTRLLHPPPAPGGSPHASRTQAPSADHINTIHAPWWGRRAGLDLLGGAVMGPNLRMGPRGWAARTGCMVHHSPP